MLPLQPSRHINLIQLHYAPQLPLELAEVEASPQRPRNVECGLVVNMDCLSHLLNGYLVLHDEGCEEPHPKGQFRVLELSPCSIVEVPTATLAEVARVDTQMPPMPDNMPRPAEGIKALILM
jgi:hypothetical protein